VPESFIWHRVEEGTNRSQDGGYIPMVKKTPCGNAEFQRYKKFLRITCRVTSKNPKVTA